MSGFDQTDLGLNPRFLQIESSLLFVFFSYQSIVDLQYYMCLVYNIVIQYFYILYSI